MPAPLLSNDMHTVCACPCLQASPVQATQKATLFSPQAPTGLGLPPRDASSHCRCSPGQAEWRPTPAFTAAGCSRTDSIHRVWVPTADPVQEPRFICPRLNTQWPSSEELGGLISLPPNLKNTVSASQSCKKMCLQQAIPAWFTPRAPTPDAEHEQRNARSQKRLFLVLHSQISRF